MFEDGFFVIRQRVLIDSANEGGSARLHVVLWLELLLFGLQQSQLNQEEVSDALKLERKF